MVNKVAKDWKKAPPKLVGGYKECPVQIKMVKRLSRDHDNFIPNMVKIVIKLIQL